MRVMELRPTLSISRNRSRVYSFVSQVLSAAKQEGAYGIVLAGLLAGHATQDVLVFGFPDPSVVNSEGLAPPDDLPLLVRKDLVSPMAGSANWSRRPVQFHDLLGLKRLSLGVEGNMKEAGSFGGFLNAASGDQGEDQGIVFGLTAAHCLATVGTAVCSPLVRRSPAALSGYNNTLSRPRPSCPVTRLSPGALGLCGVPLEV